MLKYVFRLFCTVVAAIGLSGTTSRAQDGDLGGWDMAAEVYLWGANLGGDSTAGDRIDLSFGNILDNLEAGLMGFFTARKGKWTLLADTIYLNLADTEKASASRGSFGTPFRVRAELKGFISTFGAGYQVYEDQKTSLNLMAGVRYIWLDGKTKLKTDLLPTLSESKSGSNWDGVVGVRGKTEINEKWFLTYHGDIGAGDSDLTWQAAVAANYRMKNVNLAIGYRYLDWDFDGFGPFDTLTLSGVFAGVVIPF